MINYKLRVQRRKEDKELISPFPLSLFYSHSKKITPANAGAFVLWQRKDYKR